MAEPISSQPQSWTELRKLADAHTVAILAFSIGAPLVLVVASVWQGAQPTTTAVVARVGIELVVAITLFRLARCLGEPGPLLWALAPLLHFMVGVIVFAILNMRARRRLRSSGIDVGVLGARLPEQPPQPQRISDPPASG